MVHICVRKLGHPWFRKWLVAWLAPSHYLNQCWNIVNWNFRIIFSEILTEIYIFSFKKMHLKISSGKWRPFCISFNVLTLHVPFRSYTGLDIGLLSTCRCPPAGAMPTATFNIDGLVQDCSNSSAFFFAINHFELTQTILFNMADGISRNKAYFRDFLYQHSLFHIGAWM